MPNNDPEGEEKQQFFDALLREHEHVSGFIPLYRRFQLDLLRFGLLVYTAVGALWAVAARFNFSAAIMDALMATLALLPFLVTILVYVFVTTEVRIMRASRFIHREIAPKVPRLPDGSIAMTWEGDPSRYLNGFEIVLSASTGFVIALALPALFGVGWYILGTNADPPIHKGVALGGLVLLVAVSVIAAFISHCHETRRSVE